MLRFDCDLMKNFGDLTREMLKSQQIVTYRATWVTYLLLSRIHVTPV